MPALINSPLFPKSWLIVLPSAIQPRLCHAVGTMLFCRKCARLSPKTEFTPPGWRLRGLAELTLSAPPMQGGFCEGPLGLPPSGQKKHVMLSGARVMKWLKESGWHNYNNWKQLLRKKSVNKDGCLLTCPRFQGKQKYHEGMCPQTDDILARAVTIRYNATLFMTAAEIKKVIKPVKEACRELLIPM
jgi:hypothetical protein